MSTKINIHTADDLTEEDREIFRSPRLMKALGYGIFGTTSVEDWWDFHCFRTAVKLRDEDPDRYSAAKVAMSRIHYVHRYENPLEVGHAY